MQEKTLAMTSSVIMTISSTWFEFGQEFRRNEAEERATGGRKRGGKLRLERTTGDSAPETFHTLRQLCSETNTRCTSSNEDRAI